MLTQGSKAETMHPPEDWRTDHMSKMQPGTGIRCKQKLSVKTFFSVFKGAIAQQQNHAQSWQSYERSFLQPLSHQLIIILMDLPPSLDDPQTQKGSGVWRTPSCPETLRPWSLLGRLSHSGLGASLLPLPQVQGPPAPPSSGHFGTCGSTFHLTLLHCPEAAGRNKDSFWNF